jgi:hypothetical protein
MAAEVTCAEETYGSVKKITWAWTAHTDGVVAAATTNAESTKVYNGEIIRLVTIPGAGGDAPDADYDVYIYDDDDTDVLMAGGLNRHTSNTEQVLASSLGCVANDKLTLYVSGAGSGHKGTVHLYIR